jgi:glutathione S-transferase
MIKLIQFPWSPFCLVQRRILDYARASYQVVDIPSTDRALVWKLTRGRYYAVPVVQEGRTVVFETDDESQVIAKYLETRLQLGLFPAEWEGIQSILWRHIEDAIEGLTFRLNDVYAREFVPAREWMPFLRHKERKFGRGCLERWQEQQRSMMEDLSQRLVAFEQMLTTRPFLLDQQPRFVDFDLYGMLANFLYSGHYRLPPEHSLLREWYSRMSRLRVASRTREKLRP